MDGFHLYSELGIIITFTFNRIFYHFLINFFPSPLFILLNNFFFSSSSIHSFDKIRNELKITLVPHLKYANDEDLKQVGLSKPEIRRLRKFYEKYYPHGYLSKIRRLLQNPAGKREEVGVSICYGALFNFHFIFQFCALIRVARNSILKQKTKR